jgi:GNAT superfamily N-acetyltransferase
MSGSMRDECGTLVGLFYTWWQGDPLPALKPLPGFSLVQTDDTRLLDILSDRTEAEIQQRISDGHRPYLAMINGQPAAYGWSAWERAEIGELGVRLELPDRERYLWDFMTLPDWRGRGIYPHMLQGIIRAEMADARRFWIGHDLDNVASARGIEKAGLPVIGEVWVRKGEPVFVPREQVERAGAAAALLNLAMARRDEGEQDEPDRN